MDLLDRIEQEDYERILIETYGTLGTPATRVLFPSFEMKEPTMRKRICWEETWMEIARTIARNRSPDPRLQVAAIVVTDDNAAMLALGYNGGVTGGSNEPTSLEPGKSDFLHAEANALLKTPFHYPKKKIMYITASPCPTCARMIVNAGISKVIYDEEYRDLEGLKILRNAGIGILKMSDVSTAR